MEFRHIVGNFFYILLGGPLFFVQYVIFGVVTCCTIIGIPVGVEVIRQSFPYTVLPFGRKIVPKELSRDCTNDCLLCGGNSIWFICGGALLALEHFLFGVVLLFTFVFIPIGLQHLKMIKFALSPYGATSEYCDGHHNRYQQTPSNPTFTSVTIIQQPTASSPLTHSAPVSSVYYPPSQPPVSYQATYQAAIPPPFNPQAMDVHYGYHPSFPPTAPAHDPATNV